MTEERYRQTEISLPTDAPAAGPVTCLGMEFPDDAARRAYFVARLREHLQDPAFRVIEGFPIGTDEAILALSDPPYYTACPNPFLPQIIEEWQQERAVTHAALGLADVEYHREPFAADVSEGKNDPIYNAHSYHTKVPHKAIMRYILHYTEPGDIVLDGFCGSGMTGVAAQLCGDRKAVQALGYTVDAAGEVWDGSQRVSRLGARKAVLNDLSPAATFIAYNINVTTRSKRARIYSNAHFVPEGFGNTTLWHGDGLLPEDCWVLMPNGADAFAMIGQRVVSHGGLTLDEVIVPFIEIEQAHG